MRTFTLRMAPQSIKDTIVSCNILTCLDNKGDVFKTIIPLTPKSSEYEGVLDEIQDIATKLQKFCHEPKTRVEIQKYLGIMSRSYLNQNKMRPLIKEGLLKLTILDKPTSKNQKYYSNKQMKD